MSKFSSLEVLIGMQVSRVLEILLCDEIQEWRGAQGVKKLTASSMPLQMFFSILRAPHLSMLVLDVLLVVQVAMSFSTNDTV